MDSPHIPPYTKGGAVNPEPHVFMETKSPKGSLRSSVESFTFPHSPDPSVQGAHGSLRQKWLSGWEWGRLGRAGGGGQMTWQLTSLSFGCLYPAASCIHVDTSLSYPA